VIQKLLRAGVPELSLDINAKWCETP